MRRIIRIVFAVVWLLVMVALATVVWAIKWEAGRRTITRLTFRGLNIIFGIRVKVQGALSGARPLLLVSNHCSYLDIMVLGSALPVAFTPKSEIKSWPFIGYCCRLAGCVFIERTASAMKQAQQTLTDKLNMGRVMCLFAEGTTNDGTNLKPFKSGFFALAQAVQAHLQPATLVYRARNGSVLDAQGRADIAWYDDQSLMPHLMRVLGYRSIDATLILDTALEPAHYASRKELCVASEAVIHTRHKELIA